MWCKSWLWRAGTIHPENQLGVYQNVKKFVVLKFTQKLLPKSWLFKVMVGEFKWWQVETLCLWFIWLSVTSLFFFRLTLHKPDGRFAVFCVCVTSNVTGRLIFMVQAPCMPRQLLLTLILLVFEWLLMVVLSCFTPVPSHSFVCFFAEKWSFFYFF